MFTLLGLPGELRCQLGTYLAPTDLAALASVSRDMHHSFNPILYRVITCHQKALELLESLSNSDSLASAVRKLSVEQGSECMNGYIETVNGRQIKAITTQDILNATSAMERLASSECHLVGLGWHSNFCIDTLSSLLCSEGNYQYLKALAVHLPEHTSSRSLNYGFLALPSLESLDYRQVLSSSDDYELYELELLATKVEAGLALIRPGSSILSTFKIYISLEWEAYHSAVMDRVAAEAVKTIVLAINQLRLPLLREVALYISDDWHLVGDFGPFVEAHPLLQAATLDLTGFQLKPNHLPLLQSFMGEPFDCARILSLDRSLSEITAWTWQSGDLCGMLAKANSHPNPSVKRLSFIASSDRGKTIDDNCSLPYLSASCVMSIVKAFGQVRHLELYVKCSAVLLLSSVFDSLEELECLRMHQREFTDLSDADKLSSNEVERRLRKQFVGSDGPHTAQDVFSPEQYVTAITTMAARAKKLEEVAVHLLRWVRAPYEKEDHPTADFEIEYTFYVCKADEVARVRFVVELDRHERRSQCRTVEETIL